MAMHNTLHVGNIIRHATVFNFPKYQEAPMHTDALLQAVARLFTLLHERQIAYLLVGGIAMLHYVRGRNTEDIDLIISVSALQQLPEIVLISQDAHSSWHV